MTLGTGTEATFIADVGFWVIAVSTIVATLAVVQLKDVFRAALFLVVSFLGVAGMLVLLRAEFIAVVQVLIYVGAISVLILFAILMTRDIKQGNPTNGLWLPVGVSTLIFLIVTVFVVVNTEWSLIEQVNPLLESNVSGTTMTESDLSVDTIAGINRIYSNTIPPIANLLLRDFILAFEIASVLLLAAVVGALALVKER